jgi:serine/threonine protein kinase
MDLSTGYILCGRYRIMKLLGQGGMGHVYQAWDTIRNCNVAIKKMMQKDLNTQKLLDAQKRFRQEADLLKNLSHPNLPHVHDSFIEQGDSYLVMDFIDGDNLADIVMAHPDKKLPVGIVIDIAIELCHVLDYLHSRPEAIIYRDLKPTNVMIAKDNHVYLIDFGIARVFKPGQAMDTEFFGSLGFCPPEQLLSEGQTDGRSDLFSLGATLYYCLTGHHPKNNKPTVFNFAPLPLQDAPRRLDALIQEMVATDKEKRPTSTNSVLQQMYDIKLRAAGTTTNVDKNSMGYYYDNQIAQRTQVEIQVRMWLNHLPLLAHRGWGNLYPFMLKCGTAIGSWFALSFKPFCINQGQRVASFLRGISIPLPHFKPFAPNSSFPAITSYVVLSSIFFLVFTGFGSFYLLNWQHTPILLVLLLLCLLGSLISFSATFQHTLPLTIRYELAALSAVAFLTSLVFIAQPDIQTQLMSTTLSNFLSFVLLTLALASLLRSQAAQPWLDHLMMAITSLACGLLAYNAVLPLSSSALAGGVPSLIAIITTSLFGGIALIEFFSYRARFSAWNWFLFVLLVLAYTIASCMNLQKIFTTFPSHITASDLSASDSLQVLLVLIFVFLPLFIALAALWSPARSSIIRFVTPMLAIACALQQHLLSASLSLVNFSADQHAYTLATKLEDVFSPNLFAAIGLLLLALWLFVGLFTRHRQSQLDYIGLLSVGIVFILLQRSIPERSVGSNTVLFAGTFTSPTFLYYFIPAIVLLLILAVVGLFILLTSSTVLYTKKKPDELPESIRWINFAQPILGHLILFLCTFISLWLQWFFGNEEPLHDLSLTGQTQGASFTLPQLLFAFSFVFFITSLVLLMRRRYRVDYKEKHVFSAMARFILFGNALIGALLLFNMHVIEPLSVQETLRWLGMSSLSTPPFLINIGLLLMAFILLITPGISLSLPVVRIVRFLAGIALFCTVLQFFWPPFALLALILLLQDIRFVTISIDL